MQVGSARGHESICSRDHSGVGATLGRASHVLVLLSYEVDTRLTLLSLVLSEYLLQATYGVDLRAEPLDLNQRGLAIFSWSNRLFLSLIIGRHSQRSSCTTLALDMTRGAHRFVTEQALARFLDLEAVERQLWQEATQGPII